MRVLVACEFSGVVRRAFRERGHDAWSCDLLPAEDDSPFHIQGDVLPVLDRGWDLMVAHPPCTRLCNSGVRWLHERGLWVEMELACAFFLQLLNAPIAKVAVENPVMHKYAREIVGPPTFTTQPYCHGDPFTKRTAFWLRGLPKLRDTKVIAERHPAVHRMPPGADRWKERSRTYPGIARAMAEQWG